MMNVCTKYTESSRAFVPDSSLVVRYAYDALKRRITEERASGQIKTYIYDEWQAVAEYADGALTASYVYDDGIDHPVAMITDTNTYYYHTDTRNNVAMVTDESGNVVERYSYDPYGNVTITDDVGTVLSESSIDNPYMYTSRRYDQATGLYYYRNRMYSPELGRFLQRDHEWYIDGMNVYSMAADDPINKLDPYGLRADTDHPYGDQDLWDQSAPGPDATCGERMLGGALVSAPVWGTVGIAVAEPVALAAVTYYAANLSKLVGYGEGFLEGLDASEYLDIMRSPATTFEQVIGRHVGYGLKYVGSSLVEFLKTRPTHPKK